MSRGDPIRFLQSGFRLVPCHSKAKRKKKRKKKTPQAPAWRQLDQCLLNEFMAPAEISVFVRTGRNQAAPMGERAVGWEPCSPLFADPLWGAGEPGGCLAGFRVCSLHRVLRTTPTWIPAAAWLFFLLSTAASWGFTPCFCRIRDANKAQMLSSIKYPELGGRTPGNPGVGEEWGRQGGEKRRAAVGSVKAAATLTPGGDETPRGERCHQPGPRRPPGCWQTPHPAGGCGSAAEPHVALPSRFCLAAWAIFSRL